MIKEPVRVAVVGTGSAGQHHLEAFAAVDDVEPVAVTRRSDRREALSSAGVKTAVEIAEAVAMGVSLAVIATNTADHVRDGMAALESGCDVLVEKPLSVDAAEAAKLLAASVTGGQKLYVACVLRFSESLNAFRSMLSRIGRPHAVQIECRSYLPDWRSDRPYQESYSADPVQGGVLRDLIHEIDYAAWLFGWPDSVFASLRNTGRLGIQTEELADLAWETSDGCRVSLSLDYVTRTPRRRMTALGDAGTLEWDGIRGTVSFEDASGQTETCESVQSRSEMFTAQARAFMASAAGSAESPIATGTDGLKALAVCDAARVSSGSGSKEMVLHP